MASPFVPPYEHIIKDIEHAAVFKTAAIADARHDFHPGARNPDLVSIDDLLGYLSEYSNSTCSYVQRKKAQQLYDFHCIKNTTQRCTIQNQNKAECNTQQFIDNKVYEWFEQNYFGTQQAIQTYEFNESINPIEAHYRIRLGTKEDTSKIGSKFTIFLKKKYRENIKFIIDSTNVDQRIFQDGKSIIRCVGNDFDDFCIPKKLNEYEERVNIPYVTPKLEDIPTEESTNVVMANIGSPDGKRIDYELNGLHTLNFFEKPSQAGVLQFVTAINNYKKNDIKKIKKIQTLLNIDNLTQLNNNIFAKLLIDLKKNMDLSMILCTWQYQQQLEKYSTDKTKIPLVFFVSQDNIAINIARLLGCNVIHTKKTSDHIRWLDIHMNVEPTAEDIKKIIQNKVNKIRTFFQPFSKIIKLPSLVTANREATNLLANKYYVNLFPLNPSIKNPIIEFKNKYFGIELLQQIRLFEDVLKKEIEYYNYLVTKEDYILTEIDKIISNIISKLKYENSKKRSFTTILNHLNDFIKTNHLTSLMNKLEETDINILNYYNNLQTSISTWNEFNTLMKNFDIDENNFYATNTEGVLTEYTKFLDKLKGPGILSSVQEFKDLLLLLNLIPKQKLSFDKPGWLPIENRKDNRDIFMSHGLNSILNLISLHNRATYQKIQQTIASISYKAGIDTTEQSGGTKQNNKRKYTDNKLSVYKKQLEVLYPTQNNIITVKEKLVDSLIYIPYINKKEEKIKQYIDENSKELTDEQLTIAYHIFMNSYLYNNLNDNIDLGIGLGNIKLENPDFFIIPEKEELEKQITSLENAKRLKTAEQGGGNIRTTQFISRFLSRLEL